MILLILLILLIIFMYHYKYNSYQFRSIENFFDNYISVKFPFRNILDSNNKNTNIIAITAYFRGDEHKNQYLDLKKKGYKFLGITSYLEFPGKINNPYEDTYHIKHKDDYINMCFAWCHCFREPYKIFPKNTKLALISESDFVNSSYLKPNKTKKKYDFIYICLRSQKKCVVGWQEYIHRWTFAKKCIELMVNKYKLKGILIGRHNCPNLPEIKNKKLLEYTTFLKYGEFINKIRESKFLFECSESTASPRVVTESMSLNLPVLLYKNIVGGWKYINNKTGEFFIDFEDFEKNLQLLLKKHKNKKYKSRKYILDNYGFENSGKKLLSFIKESMPEIKKTKYLKFHV